MHTAEADSSTPPAGSASPSTSSQTNAGRFVIVEGQVTDPVGAGRQGVSVRVHRLGKEGREGKLIAETTTDAFGDFAVTTAAPIQGNIVVVFTKPNYAKLIREVRIAADGPPPFLGVGLEGNLKLTAHVKDALTGRAVAGASVTWRSYAQDRRELTDPAGRATISGVSPGAGELVVKAEGYGREQQPVGRIEGDIEVTINLKPERIVHVKVGDDLNKPIAGVTVEVYDQPRDDFRTAVTGPEGIATIRGLHLDAKSLRLRLSHDGHVSSQDFDRTVELAPERRESTHMVTLRRAGAIGGRVSDAKTGKPIYSARVTTGDEWSDRSPRDWTDEVGHFMIHGVPPGSAAVTVHMAGYAPELYVLEVKAGKTARLDMKLHPSVTLKGVVKDETGRAIADAHVRATRWRGRGTLGLQAVAGNDGGFLIHDAPRDEFEITVTAPGYAPVTRKVRAGSPEPVELVLAKAWRGDEPRNVVSIGDPAPPLTLTTLDGETIRLADLRGKTVVLNFWATWCPPCIKELEYLAKVHEKFGARKDFVMIGLSRDFEEDALRDFLKKNVKVTWPQVFAEQGGVETACERFGVSWIPRVIIIGPDGRLLANSFEREEDIRKRIEATFEKR